jgi:hypothetical protein
VPAQALVDASGARVDSAVVNVEAVTRSRCAATYARQAARVALQCPPRPEHRAPVPLQLATHGRVAGHVEL